MSLRIAVVCLFLVTSPRFIDAAEDDSVVARKPLAVTARSYLLKYGFRTNQVVAYEVVQKSTLAKTKGDYTQTVRNQTTYRKHFVVIGVGGDGSAIIEPQIDRVNMSLQFDGNKPRTYDSTQEDQKPPKGYSHVAKTIGKPLVRLRVAAHGQLLHAIPLLSRRVQAPVVVNTGPAKPSNDAAKNFLIVFPMKPVRIGETWTDRRLVSRLRITPGKNGLFQEFPILRSYRLESVKGDLATIQLTSASIKPVNQPSLQMQMIELLPSTTIVFDLRRGLIISRTTHTDRKVHGFAGPGSLLHVISDHTERVLPSRAVTGNKPVLAN